METLNTIATNAHILANAEINWSPNAGMFWFTLMVVGFFSIVGYGLSQEAN